MSAAPTLAATAPIRVPAGTTAQDALKAAGVPLKGPDGAVVVRDLATGDLKDLAWAPDGRHLYVVNSGNDTVSMLDTVTRRVVSTIPMGTDPTSIAVLPNGQKGYVTNLSDGTVTVLDLAAS